MKKSSAKIQLYNAYWPASAHPASIERECIRRNGKWHRTNGEEAGAGLYHHFRRFQEIVWPEKIWQKGPFKNHWAELCLETYLKYMYIGAMGCAGSGKSDSYGSNVLTDWYCWPECTTVLVSSTDLKSLELRIWGMIKRYHKSAKDSCPWLPGHLIEGKQMLVENPRTQASEGRDFKNGIIAVACKHGTQYVGLGSYVGIHNKRVFLLGDEMNLMPRAFLDSISNLAKCQHFKLVGLGNPNETTNAHGFLCEPQAEDGGWESGIDQTPGTKTWKTKFPNGICVQFPGSDSPNMKVPPGEPPPFPFLITREQMENDARIWGVDDWHYTMMNESRMPRGQGSRRVLTRQACIKFGAFKKAQWRDSNRTSVAFLDAAYRGVGGDRCVFGELQFGSEATPLPTEEMKSSLITQSVEPTKYPQIVSLVDLMTIPLSSDQTADQPEDQIVQFVMRECEKRGIPPGHFYFDAGMRTSLVTAFSRIWSTSVNSIDSMGKPSEDKVSAEIDKPCCDYYSKFVTELWFSVRMVVESGQFRGMTDELCTEFSTREWKMVSGNRIEVESKEEMKEKLGRSPDLADAVAYGIYGCRKLGFVISRAAQIKALHRSHGRDWRDDLRDRADQLWKSRNLTYA